jgi:hypothetical protein
MAEKDKTDTWRDGCWTCTTIDTFFTYLPSFTMKMAANNSLVLVLEREAQEVEVHVIHGDLELYHDLDRIHIKLYDWKHVEGLQSAVRFACRAYNVPPPTTESLRRILR